MAPLPTLSIRSATAQLNAKSLLQTLRRRVIPRSLISRAPSAHVLVPRQNAQTGTSDPTVGVLIPTTYAQQGSLTPAAVAGIVIGSVLGTLLIIGLLVWAMASNSGIEQPDERIEVRDRASSPGRRRRRSRRGSGYDMAEVRIVRDASPRRSHRSPRHSGTRTQIVEERIVEDRVPSRSRGPSPGPSEVYIERRPSRRSGDEEVIVMEGSDFSSVPPPRRKSKRRSGGYR
jgi:hypothetical protein